MGGGTVNPYMKKETIAFFQIVYSQPNIRNMFFDKRSPQPPDVGVLEICAYFQKQQTLRLYN